MPVLEPDEPPFEPELQTESDSSGFGDPPRRTAIGMIDPEAEPLSFLSWWQKILTRCLMFLLGRP